MLVLHRYRVIFLVAAITALLAVHLSTAATSAQVPGRTPLPAPTGFGITSTTDTSATLSWDTHVLADRFKLEYKTSISTTWSTKFVSPASSGKTSTTVSG